MKAIVIGSGGQLGQCIISQVRKKNLSKNFIFYSRSKLDISNHNKVRETINSIIPNIIINASGYTDVDGAENNKIEANQINNLSVKNLAEVCKSIQATLIHISTDYVFDGFARIPYKESDKTNPKSVYGETKLAGENAIISSGCSYVIIRTSWVYSEYGKNFMKSMLELFSQRDSINIIDDQIGCPTYAQDIAKTILKLIKHIEKKELFSEILHFAGDEKTSWFNFAKAILTEKQKDDKNLKCILNPIKTSEFKTLADRPKFSALNCSKILTKFKLKPSNWNKGISDVIVNLENQ